MSRLPDESKKLKILETSFRLFGNLGYKDTTIKMVADESDIAPGSVYTYFQSKKNLYRQTSRYIWQVLTNEMDAIIYSSRDFETKVFLLGQLGINMLRQASFLLLGVYEKPTRRRYMKEHLDKICWRLLPIFKTDSAPNELKESSAENTVYFLKNYVSGILFQYLLMTTKEEQDEFIEYTWKKIQFELVKNKNLSKLGQM